MEVTELDQIAKDWGTPSFLFDIEAFQQRLKSCQDIVGSTVGLCYAMKANPFLIDAAAECGLKLEVCSPGELELCKLANIDPRQIIYSGVNKEICDITAAIETQVGVLTAESLQHICYIDQVATSKGLVVDVLPRLNAGSQFGMSKEDFRWLIENRSQFAGINIVGIHYFVYTQRKKLKHQQKELSMLLEFIDELKADFDFEVQRLEYGPGLAVPYFTEDDFSDDLAPIREMAETFQLVAQRVELTVEMGRFFASPCGCYITKVVDQKTNKGSNYAILDGGMNHLTYLGQMMGLHVPPIQNVTQMLRANGNSDAGDDWNACGPDKLASIINRPEWSGNLEWCLCGSLCTINDVLVRAVDLEDLRHNDVLAFGRCGAYSVTEGVYLFLSRTMPRILLRNANGTITLARDFTASYKLNGMHNQLNG